MNISLDTIVTVFTVLINSLLVFFIFFQGYKKKLNRLFVACLIFLILWKLTLSIYLSATSEDVLLLVGRINFAVTTLLVYYLLLFVNLYPLESTVFLKSKKILNAYSFITFAIVFITIFTPFVSAKEYIDEAGAKNTEFGILYIIFVMHLILSILAGVAILSIKKRKSQGNVKTQITLLLFSYFFAAFFAIATNVIFPFVFHIFSFQSIGPVGTIFFSLAVFINIVRYKFLDGRIILGRLLYLVIIGIYTFLAFYIVVGINILLFSNVYNINSYLLGIILSAVFVQVYNSLNKYIRDKINSNIINPGYNPDEVITKLNSLMGAELNVESIIRAVIDTLSRTIRADYESIIVYNKNIKKLIYYQPNEKKKIEEEDLKFIYVNWLELFNYPVITKELVPKVETLNSKQREFLVKIQDHKIEVILPITSSKENRGIIILGEKDGGTPYNTLEIAFVNSIQALVSLAIARSLLYEEVQQFNVTLQKKVDDATAELKVKNELLAESLKKEKDMMDIMGHELRTPLTTVRNSIVFISDKFIKKQLTDEILDKYLKIATENIRREKDMLESILQSARLENNRVQVTRVEFDADDVVEDALISFKQMAAEKNLELILDKRSENVKMNSDRTAIQQIVDNFTSNAVKYTHKGTVTIRMEDLGDKVRFSVIDTGEGIPERDLPHIGKKFYRVNTHLDSSGRIAGTDVVRPGGTGIGLYVVKGLLNSLGSDLKIESKVGEGSTFYCDIPKVLSDANVKTV